MKKNFQRAVAFIMAVMMVLTMSNWSGIATVAKAAETLTIYYYNYDNGNKPLSGTISVSVTKDDGSTVTGTYEMTAGAPSGATTTANWYTASVPVDNPGAFATRFTGSESGDAAVSTGNLGASGSIIITAAGSTYTDAALVETQLGKEEGSTASSTNIYFYNGANWGQVYATAWGNTTPFSWPGEAATAASDMGAGWYVKNVPSGDNTIVFHNNNDGGNGTYKTGDIPVVTGETKYIVYSANQTGEEGVWTPYTNKDQALAAAAALNSNTITWHYYNGDNWGSVYALYWGGDGYQDWDNQKVAATAEGNGWYKVELDKNYYAIKFGENIDVDTYSHTRTYYTDDVKKEYWCINKDDADEHGYASMSDAYAALGTTKVYFYLETHWDNAGLAYILDGTEYFTAPAEAVKGCPEWYVTEVPAMTTDVKVVQVKLSDDGTKYVWGGAAGDIVNGVPKGSTADVAIRQEGGKAYTVAELAAELGQEAGYPGNPYPDTYDVWYYNADWAGSDVYINYRSDVTGWTAQDGAPAVKMTAYAGLPGWFYADGETANLYKARIGADGVVSNAVQIFFTKDGGDQNGATSYSDHYIYNQGISADGNRADFDMNAEVLYLYAGQAYATSAELAAAAGITATPDGDTKIYIYRNNAALTGGYAVNAANDNDQYTTEWDGSGAPWYVLTVSGVNAAVTPMNFGYGRWGQPDYNCESGHIYLNAATVYYNGDTAVAYNTREALEEGLTSTFYIYCPDGAPTDVKATYQIVDSTGYWFNKTDSVENIALEAASGMDAGWYKGTVSIDAENVGYTLSYTYGGKKFSTGVNMEDAMIDGATGRVQNALRLYYYAGVAGDGIEDVNKTMWTSVYADIFYYKKGTTEKVVLKSDVPCVDEGDGWFYVDAGVSALDDRFENGVYVQFKSAEGVNGEKHTVTDAGTITAAYQCLNNYRVYATSQMSIFKSKADAVNSLKNTQLENNVPADKVRVWFFYPGGWNNYYVFYSAAAGGNNPEEQSYSGNYSQLVRQDAYASENGGSWYYADVPAATNYIYFDEDNVFDNGGNISQKYDISGRTSNEIFCVVNDSIIANGWSTSTAEIAKYYDLANVPASNEISMPVTILDYNADNLFFEYDMYWLRNMTLVLGNQGGGYGMLGMGISTDGDWSVEWPTIDDSKIRPGDAPHYDRNGKEYVTGVLEDTLVNGYPVYTEKAVTYIAKVVEKGFLYYAKDKENGAIQSYNKTELFDQIYKNITGDTELNGSSSLTACTDWHAAYEASKAKYTAADFKLAEYDITKDTNLTCMDYAYYVLNNLYDTNSNYNRDYGMYSYLVLKRTSPNVYGFYANYETTLPTSYNLPQNYEIIYNPSLEEGKGSIFNNVNASTTLYADNQGQQNGAIVEGYTGLFPYNLDLIEAMYGAGINERTDAPKSVDDGYLNQDGNAQAEINFYRYRTYNMNGEDVEVEYIDSASYRSVMGAEEAFGTESRNYNYAMKLSGKFRFDYDEDLYFTFTGDDDVVLYINGKKVLDLSGAHQAASYTVYLSDLVDDGITPMTDGAYYDLDFFYMERHTTWSNMRIETNIDVIDVSGQVQKHCYDEDGNIIGSGSTVATNTAVTYEYELNAGSGDGLTSLRFEDPALGISISPEQIVLGSYVDENGDTVDRKVEDLVVSVGSTVYRNMTEEQLKTVLEKGIAAGERILVSNIKHVLTAGVDGPVTVTMNGATDGRELSSTAEHVIYIGDPSISVIKTAANAAGTNLPNNTVLQSGTVADYTITLKNTGGVALYNTAITDEDLGVAFSVAEDGTVTAQLNEYTEPKDLTITVHGTGVADGIYKASSQEELENIISKLTQVVYPTGATLEISGIKYPITETFPSTAVGTADSVTNYEGTSDKGWDDFGKDYLTYLQSGGTEPDYTKYVKIPEGQEELYEKYADTYKTYVTSIKEDGVLNTEVPNVKDAGFDIGKQVTDDASLTLNAKQSNYTYYSQAGQTIDIKLQNETEVALDQAGTWGNDASAATKIIGEFDLTAGSHNVTFYNNAEAYGYNVNQIKLTHIDSGKEYILDSQTSGIIATGGSVSLYESGVAVLNNPGDAVTFPVELTDGGKYRAEITYISADHDLSGALVFDYTPGDYVLTDEAGNKLTPDVDGVTSTYTIGEATVTVDNQGAYPVIKYTYVEDKSGRNVFGAVDPAAGEGVTPDTITVTTYDVSDDVYVLDYGLKVELSDTKWDNGLFQNDYLTAMSGDNVYLLGTKSVNEKVDNAAEGYVYKYADGTYTNYTIGKYGAVSVNGTGVKADVIYELNKFLEGIDRYTYGVQAGKRNVDAADRNVTNSTPVMEANITIMPASIVYYEDNFSSVITNGTVYGGEEQEVITEKVWTTTWEDGKTSIIDKGFEDAKADYEVTYYPGTPVSGVEADWYAYTLGTNIVPTKVDDIYYKLTSFVDPDGNTQDGGNIFKYLDPDKEYVLRFMVIFNRGGERNFAIGAGIDAEEYAPDEDLFYTTFHAGGKQSEVQYIEIPIKNIGDEEGRSLVLYLGPTSDDPKAFSVDASFYISDVEVVEKAEATDTQTNSLGMQYGYDPVYADDTAYTSNGYTALSGTDKFAFTFKGTGFDILTRTADADLKVSVYDAEQYELKSYTYGEGKVFISAVKKAGAPADAKVLKTVTVNASYENGTVDQIPLISVDLEKYGSYIVLAQRIGDGEEALKVDGIRIYNPLGTITDEEVTDAYDKAEGEKGAKVREIRSMIFGEGYTFDYTNPADPSTARITEGSGAVAGLVQMTGNQINIATGSTVVECYTGAMTSADIAAEKAENPVNTSSLLGYAVSGPNNELYLTGEAYAFAAVVNDIGDSSMLQIGLKAVEGTAAVQYRAADGNWKDIPDAGSLSASLEMYYRIPAADLWQSNGKTVLMVRAINGTASLTHLKYQDVTFEKITREAFGDVVAGDQNDSSFNIMSSGAAGTKAVLTFSVSDQVKDFTITNKNTGEKVFTYGTAEALPSGITVSRRAADGLTIYVVKMPKTAGTYTITTSTGDSFGTAEFEIQ